MQLSRFLQSKELLCSLSSIQPSALREEMIARTQQWYGENSDERLLIASNLKRFGLSVSNELVQDIIVHVGLHYFEKLLPLCMGPKRFRSFLDMNIDCAEAADRLSAARREGKAVLCAAAHFGGVEFIVPSLASQGYAFTAALRFKTDELSKAAHAHARAFAATGLFAPIAFIEVGKPGTHAALDMAAVLRRGDMLLSVFDEKTDYSVNVSLFGARLLGGAGLDKLIAFAGADTRAFMPFMVRIDDGRYRLELEQLDCSADTFVAHMYAGLQKYAESFTEQWYFLHEEIPFADDSDK
jgi:lauroyl/myristoyl acyltransferase